MEIDKEKRVEDIQALRQSIMPDTDEDEDIWVTNPKLAKLLTEPTVFDEAEQAKQTVTVWVDTFSGTWGTIGGLKIVELEAEIAEGWDEGAASDMEIADYAREHGRDAK